MRAYWMLAPWRTGQGPPGDGPHGRQPVQSAAPQQVEEQGLGLVVGVVGQGDDGFSVGWALGQSGGQVQQEGEAGGTGGGFQIAALGRQGAGFQPFEVNGQPPGLGQIRHKGRIRGRIWAQTVVQVGHVQDQAKFNAEPGQQVQQTEAVCAAADPHDYNLGRRWH